MLQKVLLVLRNSLVLVSLIFLSPAFGNAQHVDVSINPLSALTGTAVLMVEVPVSQRIGIELQSSYFFDARRFWTPNYNTQGYRMGALAHLYVAENYDNSRLSIFAYARYLNVRYEDNDPDGSRTVFDRDNYRLTQTALGLGASYKWVLDEHFVLSGGGGLGRNLGKTITREEGNTGDFMSLGFQARTNIDLYARVTVGYRFTY